MRRLATLLVLLPLLAAPLAAQVDSGTRVRVTLREGTPRRFQSVVRDAGPDTLVVDGPDGLPEALPWSDVRRLERWNGRKGNAGVGAGVGFGLGMALGAVAASGNSCAGFSPCVSGGGGAIAGGFVGALLGLAVGAFIRSDAWQDVPGAPIRVEPAPPPPGIPGIAFQVRF